VGCYDEVENGQYRKCDNVHTRERQGFASLEELFEFLRTRMEVMIEDGETDSEHELR
jgi:hypothetical protein